MHEKSLSELYDTYGLRETLKDIAGFSHDFYMNFNHFSVVARYTRDDFFFKSLWHAYNSCNNMSNYIIGFKISFRTSGPSDWRTFGLAGLRTSGASD